MRLQMESDLLCCTTLMEQSLAEDYFVKLLTEVAWNDGFYLAFGRRFPLPRLQAWYADDGVSYHYAENLLNSHAWAHSLQQLREMVCEVTGVDFNAVLVNRYRDGNDYVGWHSDDESDLGAEPVIASLSFGATRRFHYRHKTTQQQGKISLTAGTLLVMKAPFQSEFEHAVLPEPDVYGERINLTFRHVVQQADRASVSQTGEGKPWQTGTISD